MVHGEFDEYGSLAQPQRFIQHAAGASQMSIIANTWHMPHKEKPDEVIEIFSKFLKFVAIA